MWCGVVQDGVLRFGYGPGEAEGRHPTPPSQADNLHRVYVLTEEAEAAPPVGLLSSSAVGGGVALVAHIQSSFLISEGGDGMAWSGTGHDGTGRDGMRGGAMGWDEMG